MERQTEQTSTDNPPGWTCPKCGAFILYGSVLPTCWQCGYELTPEESK